MLSFKQYLKEESITFPEFVIRFTSHYDIGTTTRLKIEREFEKIEFCTYQEIENNEVTLVYRFTSPSKYDEDDLDDIYFEAKEKVENFIYDAEDNSIANGERFISYIDGPPTFNVSYPSIEIDCQKDTDLSNVYKFIEDCKELTISNCNLIQPHPGLINILKIKAKKIKLKSFGFRQQWINIYQKYLNGSRKLQKCKEELIEAGLNDYAKF
jgi:hypothetical protein